VLPRRPVSQHAQVGCPNNLDPRGLVAPNAACHKQKETLQARSVRHSDVSQGRHAQLEAPQAVADKAESHIPWLAMMVRASRTGLLSCKKARSRSFMVIKVRNSSWRWGKETPPRSLAC
jgi:hypothetical protein